MAETFDVIYVTSNVGLTAGTTSTPVFKNITANGAITVVDANIWSGGAGTVTAYLVYSDPTGGTVGGTICTLGSAACIFAAAGTAAVVHSSTISAAAVPPNQAICVKYGAGTAGSDTCVSIGYVKGV
jgi:hypothetical protein